MTDPASEPSLSDRERRLAEALEPFLDPARADAPADRDALLAAHPDLADDLRGFLDEYDRVHDLASPLRDAARQAAEAISTVGLAGSDAAGGKEDAEGPPAPGSRIRYFGDYELIRPLGEGGMGMVYEARQLSLNRVV